MTVAKEEKIKIHPTASCFNIYQGNNCICISDKYQQTLVKDKSVHKIIKDQF